jgi:hypothetical protein
MLISLDHASSRLVEYNHQHDPKNGRFTSTTAGHSTTITHPDSDHSAVVNLSKPSRPDYHTVHAGAAGQRLALHATRTTHEDAVNTAKDYLLSHPRTGATPVPRVGISFGQARGVAGYKVTSTAGHNIFTRNIEHARIIKSKIKAGNTKGNWLDGLL